jgi:hypothetical protein
MAMKDLDAEFERIGNEMLAEAARVKCSAIDYRDGLKTIRHLIDTAISASNEMDEGEGDDDV